jgi:hypothetical protein
MLRFVRTGEGARRDLADADRRVSSLRQVVQAGCGDRAVHGDAGEDVARLLTELEDDEHFVAGVRSRLLAADSAHEIVLYLATGSAGNDGDRSRRRGGGVGRAIGELNPWLDPATGSWAVNLVRMSSGEPPSVPFLRRLVDDGPDALRSLAEPMDELSSLNQARLLVADPGQFAANWVGAGAGAAAATGDLVALGLGLAAGASPGIGSLVEDVTGRRFDTELAAQLLDGGRLLFEDPDSFGRSAVGWDQLHDDPYRWLGAQLPELALEWLAAGGAAGLRAGRTAGRARRVEVLLPPRAVRADARTWAPAGDGPGAGGPGVDGLGVDGPDGGGAHDAGRPEVFQFADLDVQRRGEPEWAPAGDVVSHRQQPFESPEGWAADVNGDGPSVAGRNVNCIDCTRAVESNWRGHDAVAAPLKPGIGLGTSSELLEDWTGGLLRPTTIGAVQRRLADLGPGSSALVVSRWGSGRAHAYNAINDAGVVKWVDGQPGQVGPWPPPYAGSVDASLAIFVGPDGVPQRPGWRSGDQ